MYYHLQNGDIIVYVAEPPFDRIVTTRHADLFYMWTQSPDIYIPSTIGMGFSGVRDWMFGHTGRPMIALRPYAASLVYGNRVIEEAFHWRGAPYGFGKLALMVLGIFKRELRREYERQLEFYTSSSNIPRAMVCSEFAVAMWAITGVGINAANPAIPRSQVQPDHILAWRHNKIVGVYDEHGEERDMNYGLGVRALARMRLAVASQSNRCETEAVAPHQADARLRR